jgi:hypothetical protein
MEPGVQGDLPLAIPVSKQSAVLCPEIAMPGSKVCEREIGATVRCVPKFPKIRRAPKLSISAASSY